MSDAPFEPDPLDDDLRALKHLGATPGDDLLARVMADADAAQAEFMTPSPMPRPSGFSRLLDAIGGWPSFAGLATAGIAGVWIGIAQPAALVQGSQALLYGDTSVALLDLDPSFGFSDLDGDL